jgi:hypothetical protein
MSKNKARVFHFDLHGKREEKYEFLTSQSINSIQWAELEVKEPGFYFIEKNFSFEFSYQEFISISKLFTEYNSGVQTEFDALCINENRISLINIQHALHTDQPEAIIRKFGFPNANLQKIINAQIDIGKNSS